MSVKFDFKTLQTGFEADWPVIVKVPQDGGTFEDQTFMARFRALPEEEREEAQKKINSGEDVDAWVNGFFVGLGREEGELTPELRKLMVGDPIVRQGIVNAYVKFTQGIAAKN